MKEMNELKELWVPTPSEKWKKWKIWNNWNNWGPLHPQRNERNERIKRIEGPYTLKEMKEMKDLKDLRAPTPSKKWKKLKKWKNCEGPHFQRNERNPPPILWKKWKKSFLSWPGLNHNGSLGWPRPIWNSLVATTDVVVTRRRVLSPNHHNATVCACAGGSQYIYKRYSQWKKGNININLPEAEMHKASRASVWSGLLWMLVVVAAESMMLMNNDS